MWFPLPTDRPDPEKEDLNATYLKLKDELTEEQARITLGGFLRYNIGFLVRVLTGLILYPDQRIIVKGWLQKNFTLTVAGRGFSKCIDENSIVLTENGLKAIKETYVGERIWANKGFQPIEGKTVNPKEDGFEIVTRSGFTCRGKKGHKVYHLDPTTAQMGWKNIEDFDGNEIIPIRHGMDAWADKNPVESFVGVAAAQANEITPKHERDLYYFLGLLLGDGCIRGVPGAVAVTSNDQEIRDFMLNVVPRYLDGRPVRASQKTGTTATSYEFSSVLFKQFLYHVGFTGEKAHKKTFPRAILGLSKEHMSAFLRGLFDTDGYSVVKHDASRNRWTGIVALTSSSWDILKTTQSVLLNYGIVSYINQTHKAGPQQFSNGKTYDTNEAWTLKISNREHIKIFSEEIGFGIGYKQDNVDQYLANAGASTYHHNLLPLGAYFRTKYRPFQFRHKGIKLHGSISQTRLKEVRQFDFLDQEDKDKLDAILSQDYHFESIKSIKPAETVSIDIQVANEACYWSDGFINHNSWLFGHFCYLYCILNPGKHVVIVSGGQFKSSRKILENIDDWSRAKPDYEAGFPGGTLLRQTIDGDLMKKPDKYTIKFKNGSSIIAVPLGDPNRLRGLRANVLGIDEGLLISQQTIDNVLKPFLFTPSETEVNRRMRVREREDRAIKSGHMKESDREVFKSQNKMIVISSASYSWEYLCELYKKYLGIIHGQQSAEEIAGYTGGSYLVHQLSWKVAPEDRVEKAIKQEIESGMYSETTIKREYEAQFVQDSDGYFRASKMKNCTIEDGQSPCIEIVGDPNAEYILGIDQSGSDSETSDHFAMCVLKIVERKMSDGMIRKIGMVVHQYAQSGDISLKEHIEYLYYLLTAFKIVYLGYDASQGANLGFINICNESELFREKKIMLAHIEADFGKENYAEIIKQVQRNYNRTAGRYVQPQGFHSDFQRAANEHLQACFDNRNVVFAGKPRAHKASFDILMEKSIDRILDVHSAFNAKSEDGNMTVGGPKDDFIAHQELLMDLVKKECALIELKSNGLGHLSWDLPSHMKRAGKTRNKVRKDSYSALLLANWCLYIYTNAMNLPPVDGDIGFVPVLIGGGGQYPFVK